MKALLRKASDYKYEREIELNELNDLLDLIGEYGYGIVVGYTAEGETLKLTLTIYDDYLEQKHDDR